MGLYFLIVAAPVVEKRKEKLFFFILAFSCVQKPPTKVVKERVRTNRLVRVRMNAADDRITSATHLQIQKKNCQDCQIQCTES